MRRAQRHRPAVPEGVAITAMTDGAAGRSGTWASRWGPASAPTVEQLSRADRAAAPGRLQRPQPARQPGRACRRQAAPDAGLWRHLPQPDSRPCPRYGGPPFLHPPVAGLEFLVPIEAMLPAAPRRRRSSSPRSRPDAVGAQNRGPAHSSEPFQLTAPVRGSGHP